ncbi:MAG: hypothetical protein ACK5LL_16800 [Suipraeoptans sp.]
MAIDKVYSLFEETRYEELFPEVHLLGSSVDYFVQCTTYEVLVPVQAMVEQRLDIFEDAVLKLLAFKPYTKDEMADTLCLTKDIVSFIRIRLRELGLLEKDEYTLSDLGKNYINNFNSKNSGAMYRQAKMFVLKATGEILPYIHFGELNYASIIKESNSKTVIEFGSVGRPIIIEGANLMSKNSSGGFGGKMLKPSVVRRALDTYNKIAENSIRFSVVGFVNGYSIENTSAEDCLLHVKVAIQEGSVGDLVASDGFVANNDYIAGYIKNTFPEIIDSLKEKAIKTNTQLLEEENNIFDFERANEGRYRTLYQPIQNIKDAYETLMEEESGASKDEYVEEQYSQKQLLLNCYAVIEHVLFIYLLEHPIASDKRNLLFRQDTYQNRELILTLGESIGIDYIRQYEYLFGIVNKKNIQKMHVDKVPNLYIALPEVIVEAFDNKHSDFRNFLKEYPGAMHTINKLHNKCKNLRHKSSAEEVNVQYVDQIYYFTTLLIEKMLPNFVYEEKDDTQVSSSRQRQNVRLMVDVNLSKIFGPMNYYNIMNESLKNEWRLIAPGKEVYPAPYEYVNTLYRILQEVIHERVFFMRKDSQISKEDLVKKAAGRWGKELPRGFVEVNSQYIKDTLKNQNTTLGAQALVYLGFCDDELLELKKMDFVNVVSMITDYRKHGNNVALKLDTTELEQLRDKVIKVTKVIGGI